MWTCHLLSGVEVSPVKDNQGGQQFLDTGDRAPRVRSLGIEDVTVVRVKDDDGLPGHGWWR